jgi:hypothetical protein
MRARFLLSAAVILGCGTDAAGLGAGPSYHIGVTVTTNLNPASCAVTWTARAVSGEPDGSFPARFSYVVGFYHSTNPTTETVPLLADSVWQTANVGTIGDGGFSPVTYVAWNVSSQGNDYSAAGVRSIMECVVAS